MQVASLHVYPVKSLSAVSVEEAAVEPRGLRGDRRAMIVDADGRFLSQREHPAMARLVAAPDGDGVIVTPPGRAPIAAHPTGERRNVTVWRETVDAVGVDAAADEALSDWFGDAVRLVIMDECSVRPADPTFADDAPVSFADGYPLLLTATASLDDLNARLEDGGADAVPMARFRPNITVRTDEPWWEDTLASARIGDVVFDFVKPCARCAVTTTDQASGTVVDSEPLRTLTRFRRSKERAVPGVLFGWNLVPRGRGQVRIGDAVEVLRTRERWPVG
ncbi:MOSC domain-containing protein [Acuticoccus sp.]|uniref:MOSC domain-containing protein n=1 Tax=Acuticoccus sp. TaxID=1904378 RepID=UPI003B51913E